MQAVNSDMRMALEARSEGFLEAYDSLSRSGDDPARIAKAQLELLLSWLLEHPGELFTELRANRPILITPGPVIVSRYRDVLEVAGHDDVYSVLPYGQAMKRVNDGPNFVLGMDSSPEFDHDLAVLKLVVNRFDLDRVRSIVADAATALVEAAGSDGQLDLTDGYGRRVPALLAGSYFGVPGPTPEILMTWCRDMFMEIFVNFTEDPDIRASGLEAGQQFRAYVDDLVQQAHRSDSANDTVLQRLIDLPRVPDIAFSVTSVRDNLIGCVVGILDNTVAGICNTVDFLLDHPDHLAAAKGYAESGDDDMLLRLVYEALRFRPPAPILVRFSTKDHLLARGTEHETLVPANKVIFAANGSAMMDETELDDPHEVRTDRPWHDYLHFGWGMHECLGKYISQVQLTELLKALLRADVGRSDGPEGELIYDGAFPASFTVTVRPPAARQS